MLVSEKKALVNATLSAMSLASIQELVAGKKKTKESEDCPTVLPPLGATIIIGEKAHTRLVRKNAQLECRRRMICRLRRRQKTTSVECLDKKWKKNQKKKSRNRGLEMTILSLPAASRPEGMHSKNGKKEKAKQSRPIKVNRRIILQPAWDDISTAAYPTLENQH